MNSKQRAKLFRHSSKVWQENSCYPEFIDKLIESLETENIQQESSLAKEAAELVTRTDNPICQLILSAVTHQDPSAKLASAILAANTSKFVDRKKLLIKITEEQRELLC